MQPILLWAIASICGITQSLEPVVYLHGIGNSCQDAQAVAIVKVTQSSLKVYSTCIEVGNGRMSSIFRSIEKQAIGACDSIKANPNLKGNISVVGFSQGALLGRYIVESCDFEGQVVNYISVGGPQMGVAKVPRCQSNFICNAINWLVRKVVYWKLFQNWIGPAGYYHSYEQEETYLQKSSFLPLLNNEREFSQERYNRLNLTRMLLVKFTLDTVIYPANSEWFGFRNETSTFIGFNSTNIYAQKLLPLQEMYDSNRISFAYINKDHLQFGVLEFHQILLAFLRRVYDQKAGGNPNIPT